MRHVRLTLSIVLVALGAAAILTSEPSHDQLTATVLVGRN